MNARIDRDILQQLDEIAAEMQARVLPGARAAREFLEREYAALCAVREGGVADIDAHRHLTHDAALILGRKKRRRVRHAESSRGAEMELGMTAVWSARALSNMADIFAYVDARRSMKPPAGLRPHHSCGRQLHVFPKWAPGGARRAAESRLSMSSSCSTDCAARRGRL